MKSPTLTELQHLARFRFALRKLLRSGEDAARAVGLRPQHHQLLLGIVGLGSQGDVTIGDLADWMQVRHHSMVGLIDRAETLGLVARHKNPHNRREVFVALTPEGTGRLRRLDALHREELTFMRRRMDILDVERRAARGPRSQVRPRKIA